MIIDFHAYIGESRLYGQKYEKAKSLVEIMDRFKIDKAVLLPTASPPVPKYYEDVVEAVKEFPDRFYGVFLANPRDKNTCDTLDRVVTQYGFRGVKLAPTFMGFPIDDETLVYPIIRKAKELGVFVIVHSDPFLYGSPWQIGLLAMDFPDVPIIMAHMGMVEFIFTDGAIKMAKRAPNIYLDTSASTSDSKVALAVKEIGGARVLYGSDMPFHSPGYEMARVQFAEISDKDKKSVLGESAARLLRLTK